MRCAVLLAIRSLVLRRQCVIRFRLGCQVKQWGCGQILAEGRSLAVVQALGEDFSANERHIACIRSPFVRRVQRGMASCSCVRSSHACAMVGSGTRMGMSTCRLCRGNGSENGAFAMSLAGCEKGALGSALNRVVTAR